MGVGRWVVELSLPLHPPFKLTILRCIRKKAYMSELNSSNLTSMKVIDENSFSKHFKFFEWTFPFWWRIFLPGICQEKFFRKLLERFSKPNVRFGSGRTGSKIVSKFRLTHNRKFSSANRNTIDHSIACPALLLWGLAVENRGPCVPKKCSLSNCASTSPGDSFCQVLDHWWSHGQHLLPIHSLMMTMYLPKISCRSKKKKNSSSAQLNGCFNLAFSDFGLILGGVRHGVNLTRLREKKLSNTWQRSDRTSEGRFCDRHEVKPNRKFDSVRGLVDRNFRTVRPRFSIQFSISSPVIVQNRRIEPKFGLLNLSITSVICCESDQIFGRLRRNPSWMKVAYKTLCPLVFTVNQGTRISETSCVMGLVSCFLLSKKLQC